MKIISVKQPWASLIIYCGKDIENRYWRTYYRGPTLIHASQRCDDSDRARALTRQFAHRIPMPTGGIIGLVDIVDCVERHRSRWFQGPYGFVLRNPRPLRFQKWKGQLGLRDAPCELLARLQKPTPVESREVANAQRHLFLDDYSMGKP